jgi:hypothetical protein
MDKSWTVDIENRKHLIEIDYPVELKLSDSGILAQAKDGKLIVDGIEVETWKSDSNFPPKQINFQVAGKPATLRRKGFFSFSLELLIEGNLIKQP